jgi:DNA-binding MarR family transcriptional regulator
MTARNWTDFWALIRQAGMNNSLNSGTKNLNGTERALLAVLFEMARTDCHATLLRLANRTGLTRRQVEEVLRGLEFRGLVDAERVRLTMSGLAATMLLGAAAPRRLAKRAA